MARTIRTDDDGPRTLTFRSDELHLLLRELVYSVSTVEAVRDDCVRTADRRRDAWVISTTDRLVTVAAAMDRALELLGQADDRSSRS